MQLPLTHNTEEPYKLQSARGMEERESGARQTDFVHSWETGYP